MASRVGQLCTVHIELAVQNFSSAHRHGISVALHFVTGHAVTRQRDCSSIRAGLARCRSQDETHTASWKGVQQRLCIDC